mgnify:CR=1 FL=1
MTNTFSIGELSKEFDVTTRTIRFYESEGLLAPTRNGQKRIYSDQDRVNLKLILRGKRLGFSLAESKDLIDLYDPESGNTKQLETLLEKIEQQRALLKQQLTDIQLMQAELDDAELRCREAFSSVSK